MTSYPSPRASRTPSMPRNGRDPPSAAIDALSRQIRQRFLRPAQPLTWVLANHARAYLEAQQCTKPRTENETSTHFPSRCVRLYLPKHTAHNRYLYHRSGQAIPRIPRARRPALPRIHPRGIPRCDHKSEAARHHKGL